MNNWVGILIAAIPTAALVSAWVTLSLRRNDRPQAIWVGETLTISLTAFPSTGIGQALAAEPPTAALTVANAGDADAYAVRLESQTCDPQFLITDSKDPRGGWLTKTRALVRAGDELNIVIRPLPGVPYHRDKATVRLIWLRAPVRHLRYEAQEFDVAHPEALPLPQPWKPPFQAH